MAVSPILPESIDLNSILDLLGIDIPKNPLPQTPNQTPLPEIPKKLNLIEVKGIIVDINTNEPIKGVRIISPIKKPTKTNQKGEFNIKTPDILNSPLLPSKFIINILGKPNEYSSTKIIPYNSIKEIKLNLGIIPLKPKTSDLKQEITKALSLKNEEVEQYATKDITFDFSQQKKLNLSINDLKKFVIPMILNLVSQYGISKVQEKLEEIKANGDNLTDEIKQQIACPNPEILSSIISQKNKLTHKINQTLKKLESIDISLKLSNDTISTINTAYQILKNIPVPTAVLGVGIPISIVNNIQDIKTFLSNNIGKLKQGSNGLSSIVGILVDVLEQVIQFLSFLDKITQYCAETSEIEISQEQISAELTALTIQQSSTTPIITNVNGFKMGVETEKTEKTLKRRRAIAQNSNGVIMLTGEWSYSSIDQILIDELVFYIQINDLKAY